MTVTNFTESQFPEGTNVDEQHNPPREDNKVLAKELEHAVRDGKEGEKYAKDFAERVDDANAKLQAEIENTVTDKDAKKFQAEVRKDVKAAEAAKATADEKAATASGVSDDSSKDAANGDVKAEQIKEAEAKATTVEKTDAAKKTTARKAPAKKSDDKPTA
ncbi:hypothetical protein SEA_BIG4_81 [Microbacterium phage Big4]|nr:hypothetical protein SEA_BIG4_81 [Microbacterium phage Big4]